jgi:hypothetical protein
MTFYLCLLVQLRAQADILLRLPARSAPELGYPYPLLLLPQVLLLVVLRVLPLPPEVLLLVVLRVLPLELLLPLLVLLVLSRQAFAVVLFLMTMGCCPLLCP